MARLRRLVLFALTFTLEPFAGGSLMNLLPQLARQERRLLRFDVDDGTNPLWPSRRRRPQGNIAERGCWFGLRWPVERHPYSERSGARTVVLATLQSRGGDVGIRIICPRSRSQHQHPARVLPMRIEGLQVHESSLSATILVTVGGRRILNNGGGCRSRRRSRSRPSRRSV